MMNNVVDSSAWLEYFAGSPRARYFAKAIETTDQLVVPSISLYEVFKKVLTERDETAALQAVHYMQLGTVLDLTADLALTAATLSKHYRLPMADSIILATAQFANAAVWTQDSDFKNIPGVHYFPKK
jgi:predicted nucleic acid-binding protein